ncbi:MAG: radical SAM protein [Clostridium sp.]
MKYKQLNYKTIFNGDKVIISNISNGNYLKTSKKYYDEVLRILRDENNELINEYPDYIRNNINNLLNSLIKIGVVKKSNERYIFENIVQDLKSIFIICTNKCNLKCKHCSKESSFEKINDLESEKLKTIFDRAAKLNPLSITLSGGEPLCRVEFLKELKYLRSIYDGKIILSTNSLLINEENVKEIVGLIDTISISLDGVDEETCSDIRGKYYYANVMSKIDLIKKNEFANIFLSMTVTKTTEKHKTEFVELCKKLECKPVLRRFTPIGRGQESQEHLMSNVIEQAIELKGDIVRAKECSPIYKEICIDENGDVYPCQLLMDKQFCLGNLIKNESLQNIINNKGFSINEEIEKIRPYNSDKCGGCKVNLFCWSCLGNYINIKNNEKMFNELCEHKKELLMTKVWN